MSGHSKWHTIRRAKGVLDQRRGQLFTKLARDITIAAREGGSGDPDMNFRLRIAVDRARGNNMPADSIQRAIDRGMGKGNESQLEEVQYEGYAPGGVAIIIEAATDNRNRTAAEVRAAFTKAGCSLGELGSVSWMFDLHGLITVDLSGSGMDPEEAMMMAIDAGADDVVINDDILEIYTDFKQLITVREALAQSNFTITNVEKTMRPKTQMQAEAGEALKALRLIDKLEELDDVQKVYSNLDITDEVAEQFAEA